MISLDENHTSNDQLVIQQNFKIIFNRISEWYEGCYSSPDSGRGKGKGTLQKCSKIPQKFNSARINFLPPNSLKNTHPPKTVLIYIVEK